MFHKIHDDRIICTSIMTALPIKRYIDLISRVYENKGGLPNQRAPLKTKTAMTIRKRMVLDIQNGAVLPPIVIGILIENPDKDIMLAVDNVNEMLAIVEQDFIDRVSVIDGMQRTTAILEALESKAELGEKDIRVEFWVSDNINSLIYRMLVLNTGQVPWEIGRQLDTIYSPFVHKIKMELAGKVDILTKGEVPRRSVDTGQYQSEKIIELLLLFSSRKAELDLKDKIAEDFARLDMIESTSHPHFIDYFIETLKMLVSVNECFSRFQPDDELRKRLKRITSGKDICASFPAMVGFCTAMSIYLFDEPGFTINWSEVDGIFEKLKVKISDLLKRLNEYDNEQLSSFLQIELLEEKLSRKSTQVGRYERDLYKNAFMALFKNADRVQDLTPCWMAR